MPVSSKKIIEYIQEFNKPFTAIDLSDRISSTPLKKKKIVKTISHKEQNIISDLLFILSQSELIRKNKKSFSSGPFTLTGNLKISSKGLGTLENDIPYPVSIEKSDLLDAQNNDYVTVKIYDFKRGLFYGRVVKIDKRSRNLYTATAVRKTPGSIIYKIIDSPGNLEIASERFSGEPDTGETVIVELKKGTISNFPACTVIKIIRTEDESSDFERLAVKHSLPGAYSDFGSRENFQKSVSSVEMLNRKDYRDILTFTIDGEDAKDFDDAVSIIREGDNFRLFVHIADVSAYVKKGSPLDREAYSRGTSYYLVNRVIPMLPEVLSNDLCSLREGEDKLVLSVEVLVNSRGDYLDTEFHRGIIKSDKRLTYNIASDIIENEKLSPYYESLNIMFGLASALKENRMKRGRIDLNLSDVKIIYKDGNVSAIKIAERLKSHMIVEEFMLTANEIVSMELTKKGIPSLYRVHERMSEESIEALKKFVKLFHFKIEGRGNIGVEIQKVLDKIKGLESEYVVNLVVLKSMMQANYGPAPDGHFGLGFADYTHFTSPIRRYPDLVVHRCLKNLMDGTSPDYSAAELSVIGEKTSELERVAQKAERDLVKIKSCRILSDRVGEVFEAVISGIAKHGFFVTLLEMPIEGMVPLRNLHDDYYNVNESDFSITGRKKGKIYSLGNKLKIRLVKADIDNMRIDFELP